MKKIKQVGYLGPEGTFSNEAALRVLDGNSSIVPFDGIWDIFEALVSDEIDEAVLPIENSTEGSVSITLDALSKYDLKIKAELYLPIKHNLLVQKGKSLDDIHVICSHSQALAQCRNYLNKLHIPVHAMPSTSNAARYVMDLSTAAAVGNEILSKKYNLEILERNIQDYDNNVTRFVVVSREDMEQVCSDSKTSIIIALNGDRPGGLYEVLKIFASGHINLTKIESRPSKQGIGKYIFFIDFEGHRNETHVKEALTIIEDNVRFFKILGSYRQDFERGD